MCSKQEGLQEAFDDRGEPLPSEGGKQEVSPRFTVDYRPGLRRFPYVVVPLTGKEIYKEVPRGLFDRETDARRFADQLNEIGR